MGTDAAPVLNRVTFDDFAGLFDADELRDVIEQWHADSAAALEALADALTGGDHRRAGEIAHRTAGGGMALGATALAHVCEGLRASAESGEPTSDADLTRVRAVIAATYAAMVDAAASLR